MKLKPGMKCVVLILFALCFSIASLNAEDNKNYSGCEACHGGIHPVDDIRARGTFRDDFLYRLCSDIIRVPPLRVRIQEDPKELEDLVAHTITRMVGTPYPSLVKMVLFAIDENLGKAYPWPGNVRELEQCVRSVLIKRKYKGAVRTSGESLDTKLKTGLSEGSLDAQTLLQGYCRMLYQRYGTYEAVARRTGLDRRTVKKHIVVAP